MMKMTESPPFRIDVARTEKLRPHGKKKREARIKSVKLQPYPLTVGHELSVLGKEPVRFGNSNENASSDGYVFDRRLEELHMPCIVANKVASSECTADRLLNKRPKAPSAVIKKSPDFKSKRQLGGIVDIIIPKSQYKDMTDITGCSESRSEGARESISSNSSIHQVCKKLGEHSSVRTEIGSDKENGGANKREEKGFNYSEVNVERHFIQSDIRSLRLAEIFPEVKNSVIKTSSEEFPFIPPPIIPFDVRGKKQKRKSKSGDKKAPRETKNKGKVKVEKSSKYSGRPFLTRESRMKFWKRLRKKMYRSKKKNASNRQKVCKHSVTLEAEAELSGLLSEQETSEICGDPVEPQKSASSRVLPEEQEVIEIEVAQEVTKDHELIDLVEDEIKIVFERLHKDPPPDNIQSHNFSNYCTQWFNYRHRNSIAGSPVLTSDTFS